MKILFITDYFKNSGLGNYLRSKYLFRYIKKINKRHIYKFAVLSKLLPKKIKYDVIVLDLPYKKYNISKITKNYSNKDTKILGLDYNFKKEIDCNISVFAKNKKVKKNYIGLKYSIIRREFFKNKFKINNNLFFISIGSSDINKIKIKVKNIFRDFFSNIFVSKNLSSIKKNNPKQINYVKKMITCKMAASNSGTTLLELLFLKKIVFVYPQNEPEYKFAIFLKNKGFKIFINKYNLDNKFLANVEKMPQMKGLIDHLGIKRISKIILNSK